MEANFSNGSENQTAVDHKQSNDKHSGLTPREEELESTDFDEDWTTIGNTKLTQKDVKKLDKIAAINTEVNIILSEEKNRLELEDHFEKTKYDFESNLGTEKFECKLTKSFLFVHSEKIVKSFLVRLDLDLIIYFVINYRFISCKIVYFV